MKWGTTLSALPAFDDAFDEAAGALAEQVGAPDLVVAFVSPHHAADWRRLPARVHERFPRALLIGCSGGGVIGGGRELEREAGLALVGAELPGVSLAPFHLEADEVPEPGDGAWRDLLPLGADRDPQFVLLTDPFTFETDRFVRGLDAAFPAAVKIGGLASGARTPGGNALFLGDALHASGCVGLALSGDLAVDTIVAQGCRPIGLPMFATQVQGRLLYQLDGRPAIKVLEELYAELAEADRALFRTSLFLGIVMAEGASEYRQGDFLVRNILGVDPDAGAIAAGASLEANAVVQFHLRDARTSAADLEALLARYREGVAGAPAGALLFSCTGRGRFLYGEADHDTGLFRKRIGPVPVGGFFCNGEIGPVGGRTFLHGYTSSFGLFRPRGGGGVEK